MAWEGLQTNGMILTVSEIVRRLREVRNQLLENQ